jgi:hypothetical protein
MFIVVESWLNAEAKADPPNAKAPMPHPMSAVAGRRNSY